MAEASSCNTVLCRQVYLPGVRATLQLDRTCCNVQGLPAYNLGLQSCPTLPNRVGSTSYTDLRQNLIRSGSIFHSSLQVIFLGSTSSHFIQALRLCMLTAFVCLSSSSVFLISYTSISLFVFFLCFTPPLLAPIVSMPFSNTPFQLSPGVPVCFLLN